MSTDYEDEASILVNKLLAQGMTPHEISEAMEQRVSYRTIYRWSKKESGPQQRSDLDALRDVAGTDAGRSPSATNIIADIVRRRVEKEEEIVAKRAAKKKASVDRKAANKAAFNLRKTTGKKKKKGKKKVHARDVKPAADVVFATDLTDLTAATAEEGK